VRFRPVPKGGAATAGGATAIAWHEVRCASVKIRAVHWLILAAAIVALAVVLTRRGTAPTRSGLTPTRPLAVIPPGAAFVLTADLARLRTTAAGRALAETAWQELDPGRSPCGFEPLRDVDQVALAVPGEGLAAGAAKGTGAPDIVVVASGRFVAAIVADCAAQKIAARGGEVVRTGIGSFITVRDRKSAGEIAVRNGLLVLSDGAYLRNVLDAADGHAHPGSELERASDALHSELRRSFGKNAPLIATLALPAGWLERAVDDPEAARSPLANLRSAALRAEVAASVTWNALLACEAADGCAAVERFLASARNDLTLLLGPSIGAELTRVRLERRDARIELAGTLTLEQLRSLAGELGKH
jgi:hypothetical protein